MPKFKRVKQKASDFAKPGPDLKVYHQGRFVSVEKILGDLVNENNTQSSSISDIEGYTATPSKPLYVEWNEDYNINKQYKYYPYESGYMYFLRGTIVAANVLGVGTSFAYSDFDMWFEGTNGIIKMLRVHDLSGGADLSQTNSGNDYALDVVNGGESITVNVGVQGSIPSKGIEFKIVSGATSDTDTSNYICFVTGTVMPYKLSV